MEIISDVLRSPTYRHTLSLLVLALYPLCASSGP